MQITLSQMQVEKKPTALSQIHENECFLCNKPGNLQLCDVCPRAYHPACEQIKLISQQQHKFGCSADQPYRPCQFCQTLIQTQKSELKCTICLRPAHLECYELPSFADEAARKRKKSPNGTASFQTQMEEESSYLLYNEKSYVCKPCFHRNGVRQIKRRERVQKTKNFVVQQYLIALVHINYKSPIHYGWFAQNDIKEAAKNRRDNQYYTKKKQPKLLQTSIVEMTPFIERILTYRLPRAQVNKTTQLQGLKMLKDNDRVGKLKFGGSKNCQFLVKWLRCPYSMATWEDEMTVRYLDNDKYMQNFIKRLTTQLAIPKEEQEDQTIIPPRKNKNYLSRCIQQGINSDSKAIKMLNYRWIYTVQVIINDRNDYYIRQLTLYLKMLHMAQKSTYPSLLIVPSDKIREWEQYLRNNADGLKYLIFSGSNINLNVIKQTQFIKGSNSIDFQLIVIDPQCFNQNQQFIESQIYKFEEIIITNFVQPELLSRLFSLHKKDEMTKVRTRLVLVVNRVFNNRLWEQEIIRKTCCYFDNIVLKHTLSWSELQCINCKKSNKDNSNGKIQNGVNLHASENQIDIKLVPLPELQRIMFLTHVIKFGYITHNNLRSLYQTIYGTSCDRLYGILSGKSKSTFKNYVKNFYKILTVYQQIQIPDQTLKNYLFGIHPAEVTKRCMQLFRLRQVMQIDDYQFNIKPTPIVDEHGNVIGKTVSWNNQADYILGMLILRHGYGNWQAILDETRYGNKKKQEQVKVFTYSFYLRISLKVSTKREVKGATVSEFLRMRAEAILHRMSNDL